MEAWRTFQPGDKLAVRNGVGIDSAHDGRRVTFVRYSQPHGYAVVTFTEGGAPCHLHPESLVKADDGRHDDAVQASADALRACTGATRVCYTDRGVTRVSEES